MTTDQLYQNIRDKQSFLCVGLDSALEKIPGHIRSTDDPVFNFNKAIIDATAPFAVAFKPNLAFYESRGLQGWSDLEKTVAYIRQNYPDVFIIADAKRGDIGNTSRMYAQAFFENMEVDAVTVAPYMGEDSVKPFLSFQDRFVILLALTSNPGASDFQFLAGTDHNPLFMQVLEKSRGWGSEENMMYVVGATKASMLVKIREAVPHHFLLVPGVGAQGGSLQEVAEYGMNRKCGLLVNASRSVIFAGIDEDFAVKAAAEAESLQREMSELLQKAGLLD